MNTQQSEFGNEMEFATEFGNEFEFGNESGQEMGHEFEGQFEFGGNQEMQEMEMNSELHESLEMELAHELLNVTNEQELNMFLGKLIRGVGRGIRNFARSGVGQAIGGALKKVAKVAIPIAGKALGGLVGGPIGAMVGGKLASAATNLFELELEGLSPEDREFEVARAYVRFANDAIQTAARQSQRSPNQNPMALANRAINQSARMYAPGLLNRKPNTQMQPSRNQNGGGGMSSQGRWVRRGNQITLFL